MTINDKSIEALTNDEIEFIEDSNTDLTNTPPYKDGKVSEIERMRFGKNVLWSLLLVFIIAMVLEIIRPHNAVFEACKITIPSLATLIIGYYFAKS